MQTLDRDEVRLVTSASPARVHALIADVTRMPEFSPEVVWCRWLDGATGPAVGARFAARNKFRRGPSAVNKPVITGLQAGRLVSWSRTEPFGGTVEWTYEFLPHADGTEVVVAPVSATTVHVVSSGGMAGWQIALIAIGAALLAATAAVVLDRARAARRAATATTA